MCEYPSPALQTARLEHGVVTTPWGPLSVCAFRKSFWCQQFSFRTVKQYGGMMLRTPSGKTSKGWVLAGLSPSVGVQQLTLAVVLLRFAWGSWAQVILLLCGCKPSKGFDLSHKGALGYSVAEASAVFSWLRYRFTDFILCFILLKKSSAGNFWTDIPGIFSPSL